MYFYLWNSCPLHGSFVVSGKSLNVKENPANCNLETRVWLSGFTKHLLPLGLLPPMPPKGPACALCVQGMSVAGGGCPASFSTVKRARCGGISDTQDAGLGGRGGLPAKSLCQLDQRGMARQTLKDKQRNPGLAEGREEGPEGRSHL